MELLKELEIYINALERVKDACHEEILNIVLKYENEESVISENKA